MKRCWNKAGLLFISMLCSLVLLEAILQAGALLVRGFARRPDTAAAGGELRILCLGDSNTYGFGVEREETYPRRLEGLLNERGGGRKWTVLNAGFPGTNSSLILRNFEDQLKVFKPDVVLLKIGVNDFWTVPVSPDSAQTSRSIVSYIQQHSRLYRLAHMTMRGRNLVVHQEPDSTVEKGSGVIQYGGRVFDMGWQKNSGPKDRAFGDLVRNITALTEKAKKHELPLVLLNYASQYFMYGMANEAIREAARKTGAPFVDLNSEFRPLCPVEPCSEWLLPDSHPTAKGYEVIAKTVMGVLPHILAGRPSGSERPAQVPREKSEGDK